MRKTLLAAILICSLLIGAACLLSDSEEEFLAYCTDRYGMDESNSDCECYWEEMREDGISPGDIVRHSGATRMLTCGPGRLPIGPTTAASAKSPQ